ncbi:MAG: ATP-binding cassette domain-containing protein [Rhizobiaceae bacterium]
MAGTSNQSKGLTLRSVEIRLADRLLVALDALVLPGEVLTVMGPSGSGKSTLLAYIGGFLDKAFAATGEVLIDGEDQSGKTPQERHAGILFQDPLLFPHMTVGGNLTFALSPDYKGRAARRERCEAALRNIGLEGYFDRDPQSLSGGEKARVALARVLLSRPRTLLLDEPFSKLDHELRGQMRALVFDKAKARGLPVVLVTHDPADAEAAGGRVVTIGD